MNRALMKEGYCNKRTPLTGKNSEFPKLIIIGNYPK